MSTREMANTIYYSLTEEQLKRFIALFGLNINSIEEVEPDDFDRELIADSEIDNDDVMDLDDYVRSLGMNPEEKAKRNADYLAKIDKAAAQFEAGKGQIHDLIEVEDEEVLAMHIDNRAIVLNPEKAEEFLAQKADPKVKAEILRKSKELRKNMIRDDRFKKE